MAKLKLVAEPGQLDIRMSRDFDAPRDLVFKAYTDPMLVPQWWGPKSLTTVVDKMDIKMGGIWRFIHRDAEGTEYAFFGVYHQIVPPERIIYTFEFEGMPGHVLLETISFEEQDGKTRLVNTAVFQTVEDRDGMIETGMESGAAESWERFDELLKTL